MTDIKIAPLPINTNPAAPPPEPSMPPAGSGKVPLQQPLSAEVLKEMGQLAVKMAEIANLGKTVGPQGTGNKAGSNPVGVGAPPTLAAPILEFSAEEMALILTSLQSKTSELQMSNAKEGLNISKKKMEDLNSQALDKIKTMIESAEKATKMDNDNKIMGWVGKIAGFFAAIVGTIIAVALTVVSGGLAAPLLVLAVAGLVGSTMALAGQISEAAGGPPLDLGSLSKMLVSKIVDAIVEKQGEASGLKGGELREFKEKATAKLNAVGQVIVGLVASTSLAVVAADPSFIGNAVGGLATLFGADEAQAAIVAASFTAVTALVVAGISIALAVATGGAAAGSAIAGVMNAVVAIGQVAQAGLAVAQGALGIAQGAVGIMKAIEVNKGDLAMVDKKMISGLLVKLQKDMEEGKEDIKKVIDQIMESMTLVSQMINSGAENRTQINANMGSSRMNTI